MRTTNYLTLDTETATLPFVNEWNLTSEQKKKIAIAKPLVYDIGWTIANRTQGIIKKRNFLIAETFSVPSVFNTAYYREKRPLYLDMIAKSEAIVLPWDNVMDILVEDLEECKYITAYNAMFDFKKAIPFTELYIRNLYSPKYHEWENLQREFCERILSNPPRDKNPDFDPENFLFRNRHYTMIDVWGIACSHLLNNDKFRCSCINNGRISPSGLYFSTSAETCFQYLIENYGFIEDHTALSDAEIETEILFKALKRGKIETGINYFPYKMLGETVDFVTDSNKATEAMAEIVANKIREYLPENFEHEELTRYQKQVVGKLLRVLDRWGE